MNISTEVTDTSIGSIWSAWYAELPYGFVGIGDTESDAIADLLTRIRAKVADLQKLLEETDE